MRTFIKRCAELAYWSYRRVREGRLDNSHYEPLFTTHVGLDRSFYAGKRVLDIGCGPRGSLEWATDAAERVGLDPLADRYLALGARRHAMTYVASGAEAIPYPDGYFDVVSSFNSLDHVDRLDDVVREICRVTRPTGTFILATDVNHRPTLAEPLSLDWDVVDRFGPALAATDVRRYEKVGSGMYTSLEAAEPYDDGDPTPRYGVLVALMTKPATPPKALWPSR